MKTLLLVLSLIISLNVNASDYANQYKNAPPSDNYITLQAQTRMRELKSQIFKIESMIKYNKASAYQIELCKKLSDEYKYISTKYGNKRSNVVIESKTTTPVIKIVKPIKNVEPIIIPKQGKSDENCYNKYIPSDKLK